MKSLPRTTPLRHAVPLAALLLGPIGQAATAAEVYKVYDNFNAAGAVLDTTRWNQPELVREVVNGQLQLRHREVGQRHSNTGTLDTINKALLAKPQAINRLRAKVTVMQLEVADCPATGSDNSAAMARIVGSYFHIGAASGSDRTNDVIAQVRVGRTARSTLEVGQLGVEGVLARCNTADCSSATVMGSIQSLGTVALGTALRIQVDWDKASKRFIFTRDADASTAKTVSYTEDDSTAPVLPFKSLQTRTQLANCYTGPAVEGLIDARFDDVYVNTSGLP